MHEVTPTALSAETLGMRIILSHGVCGHTDKRIFRQRSASRVLMHRRRVSGRVAQLIAVISDLELSPLEERCPFFGSLYKFAAMHWMSRGIPWDPLKCELRAYAGLISWFSGAYRWNAFKKGWSFASRTALVSLVSRHGRVLERSCFCSPAGSERAREDAFQQLALADTATEGEFSEMKFEEVPNFLEFCAERLSVDSYRSKAVLDVVHRSRALVFFTGTCPRTLPDRGSGLFGWASLALLLLLRMSCKRKTIDWSPV